MPRQRKERYGTGLIWYEEKQLPLSEEREAKILELLQDAKSITYNWGELQTVIGPYLQTLCGHPEGHCMAGNREYLAAIEKLLRENGWELKWTRKRRPPQKQVTPADERDAFERIMSQD
jgi:hypothetical protein